jgi:hypothetical protein
MAEGNLHTNHMVACLATFSIRLSDRELPYPIFGADCSQSARVSFAPNWVVGGPGIIFNAIFLRKLQSKPFPAIIGEKTRNGTDLARFDFYYSCTGSNFLSFHWITDIVPDS